MKEVEDGSLMENNHIPRVGTVESFIKRRLKDEDFAEMNFSSKKKKKN